MPCAEVRPCAEVVLAPAGLPRRTHLCTGSVAVQLPSPCHSAGVCFHNWQPGAGWYSSSGLYLRVGLLSAESVPVPVPAAHMSLLLASTSQWAAPSGAKSQQHTCDSPAGLQVCGAPACSSHLHRHIDPHPGCQAVQLHHHTCQRGASVGWGHVCTTFSCGVWIAGRPCTNKNSTSNPKFIHALHVTFVPSDHLNSGGLIAVSLLLMS